MGRQLWLSLIYLALEYLQDDSPSSLVPPEIRSQHSEFVVNVLTARRNGRALSGLVIEEVAGGASQSVMEAAILKQSMKLLFTVVEVLDNVGAAGGRNSAPRPFIPGPDCPACPHAMLQCITYI